MLRGELAPAAPARSTRRTCSASASGCSGLLDDLDRNRIAILRSLTLLRQLSLDPSLVDEAHAGKAPSARSSAGRAAAASWPPRGTARWSSASSPGSCGWSRDAARPPRASTTPTSTARPGTGAGGRPRFTRGRRAGLPHQPQGRRLRAHPHRGRLRLRARPVVEPRGRGAGRGPRPPHRPGPDRHGLPAGRRGHHRGEGRWRCSSARRDCSRG